MTSGQYPFTRMRRNRYQSFSRKLVQENTLHTNDLIYPVFIIDQQEGSQAIDSMPSLERHGLNSLIKVAHNCVEKGIPAIALFPAIEPSKKSLDGRESYNPKSLVSRAIKLLKKETPNLGVIADIALDPYTSHGQDGILSDDGTILNDETVSLLKQQALCVCEAGADIIAPSDMMDGRIGALRGALEEQGFQQTQILSYSAKYASHFYSPFRGAVGSVAQGQKIDKTSYQMDPANIEEALHETALDIQEGADLVMIKPAMLYCDVIKTIKEKLKKPTFAYQVSGEFAMLKAASSMGYLNEKDCALESLLCLKRAGADAILSYYALDVPDWLAENNR